MGHTALMLKLLGVPEWQTSEGVRTCLPVSLPACLLVYLACQGRWLDREAVALVFWPERSRDEARHNLRVNLHRVRQLLNEAGFGEALLSERSRVCLQLPTDLDPLRAAIASADGAALLHTPALAWLDGFRISGFDDFWDWAQRSGAQWQQQWREASASALKAQQGAAVPAPWASGLQRLLRLAPGGDEPAEAPALFGREQTLQALRDPQPRALVLIGEAGVGKSSLLSAAFAQAPLLQGREGLAQIPYRPLAEYLQAHLAGLRALLQQPASDLTAYRLDLARLLPELAPNDALPPLDALTAKARLLEALCRVFEAQTRCLLIDDLQWCDGATLEFLSLLTHRGATRWRAAARGHELTPAQQVWLATLQQSGHAALLPLQGLSLEAVELCCARRWPGRSWTRAQCQRLHAASTGNPFVLQELLMEEGARAAEDSALSLPSRVRDMLQRRLQVLPAAARALVEAGAVLARPMPLQVLSQVADLPEADALPAARSALQAELLREEGVGLQCRHDLVRNAVETGLAPMQKQALHRRAALALAARPEGDAEPLAVAAHWSAALEPQTALAWMQRGAVQLKLRGRFDEARALWQRVADESLDATQALQARLALAECELLTDLARGRAALLEVLEQVPAVAEPLQRQQIEGQALSGLIDNAVFAGDMATARSAAVRLRQLLPRLRAEDRVHACEVLIELAMREPDIAAAWALLDQVRRLAPNRPGTLSFEAQIHWFAGDVRAARDAFEALLAAHPDYCSGLTIENDLAVMLHALGELPRAELMARRSLASWQGVAHTETLSLLVLGSIMTSAGRHDEALTALDQALQLGRDQGSALFEAEALLRRARLRFQAGEPGRAKSDLDAAEPLLRESGDPLRVSQYAVTRVQSQIALGERPDRSLRQRLGAISERSSHPLLLARIACLDFALARLDGDATAALQAAERQAGIAHAAGLQELMTEARAHLASLSSLSPACLPSPPTRPRGPSDRR